MLTFFSARQWDKSFPAEIQQHAIQSLESGHILYLPELAFSLSQEETYFLSPAYADPHSKNIGYHPLQKKLWGVQCLDDEERVCLKKMLDRFSHYAHLLLKNLLPLYDKQLTMGRTSFRPVQISDRKTSYRKDDKRLHVDAFPSSPNQGKRILRVFCNINPHREDRIWRVGEPFEKVAKQFLPTISRPLPGNRTALRVLNITKSYRTLYDHYMLRMHNRMKADEQYQAQAEQQIIRFPTGSSWIVQTDHVSHAAMQGQYVLEQTFYFPVDAMQNSALSPLKILEKLLNQPLV